MTKEHTKFKDWLLEDVPTKLVGINTNAINEHMDSALLPVSKYANSIKWSLKDKNTINVTIPLALEEYYASHTAGGRCLHEYIIYVTRSYDFGLPVYIYTKVLYASNADRYMHNKKAAVNLTLNTYMVVLVELDCDGYVDNVTTGIEVCVSNLQGDIATMATEDIQNFYTLIEHLKLPYNISFSSGKVVQILCQ